MTAFATDPWEALIDRFDPAHDYRARPADWVHDKLGAYLWAKQREIANSIVANRYTAVPSAHELGKSWLAAQAICWWIDAHPPGEAFVVSTAPSAAQVSAVMWREVGKTHRVAELDGRILTAGYPQWKIGSELVGYGRKPADYEQSAFQGIHARYVLVVIDEACGVVKALYDAIDSIVANANSRVLAIGNPDDAGTHFAQVCKPGSGWNVIQLDALRSPNMTAEQLKPFPLTRALMRAEGIKPSTEAIPPLLRELLVEPVWVEERIERWAGVPRGLVDELSDDDLAETVRRRCATSALVQAKVRGIFPSASATGVIPLGWIEQAMARWQDWSDDGADTSAVTNPRRHVVGVDVAYGGEDETVLALRYGDVISELQRFRIADTVETADFAAATLHETLSAAVVDVIGIGAGVYDTLRRYKRENKIAASVYAFNAAQQSQRRDKIGQFRFRNDRSAAWWRMRELLDPSKGSTIALPPDERLKEELCAPKHKMLVGGIIAVESKDDIRIRLGRSTDTADAVIQAFWIDGMLVHTDGTHYYDTESLTAAPTDYAGYDKFTQDDMHAAPGARDSMRVQRPAHAELDSSVFSHAADWASL